MPDERSWRDEDQARRRREMAERDERPGSRWGNERSYSSDRPYGDGDYGWRGEHREYGWRGEPEYSSRPARGGDPRWREERNPADPGRDYSGVSWGLSGGHRQDRDVVRSGAGLEAGYASYHRPDAPDWRAVDMWRVPGPHTGRGPRGYQRSDERIRDEVNDRLTAHGWIDASDIECKVENGEVLLTGFVDSRAAKRAAEDLAEDVPGVREVHNHLRLRSSAPDADGIGRTSVLGLTEHQAQTRANIPPEQGRSRTRS